MADIKLHVSHLIVVQHCGEFQYSIEKMLAATSVSRTFDVHACAQHVSLQQTQAHVPELVHNWAIYIMFRAPLCC